MSKVVTIVDYGIGNVLSVARAFEHCGAQPRISADPKVLLNSDYLVLPGVGAFADGMNELRGRNLVDSIEEFGKRGRPFLGICLGMQMMFDSTEEFGQHAGLGLIAGAVVAIPSVGPDGTRHKLPHIGWNRLIHGKEEDRFLRGVAQNSYVYFVHSYTALPNNENSRISDTEYNGCRISAIVRSESVYGCQFHPEKSGEVGLQMIRNFISL